MNAYVEAVITPKKGSDERVYVVESMWNLESPNVITHHLMQCLFSLMSAGVEYNPVGDHDAAHRRHGGRLRDERPPRKGQPAARAQREVQRRKSSLC